MNKKSLGLNRTMFMSTLNNPHPGCFSVNHSLTPSSSNVPQEDHYYRDKNGNSYKPLVFLEERHNITAKS